ncbi:MAG: hypothetical protein U5K73_00385 [Halofilum sp. (in: g-proteobacteria)]|nr:hypothetical protein [Halofilum sp. (in: g-proteobacteria)]
MRDGERLAPAPRLADIRARAEGQRAALPAHLRRPEPPTEPYPVTVSDALEAERERLLRRHHPDTSG